MPSSSPLRPTPPRSSLLSPSADRSLQRAFRDHDENGTENRSKSTERASQSGTTQLPKRPWVTHFSKLGTTPSPKKKILAEHNNSNSPASARSIRGGSDSNIDKQRDVTPERQRREDSSPAKDVAELSKRIQQFLEDQESLLGVRNGTPHDSIDSMSNVSTQPRQSNNLSPYDPYHSPFCNRPQFLRWQGKASPADATGVRSDNGEELPLFDGDHNIVSLPPQNKSYFAVLSPEVAPKLFEKTKETEPTLTESASEHTKEWKSALGECPALLLSENTPVRLETAVDAGDEEAAKKSEEVVQVGETGSILVAATTDEHGNAGAPDLEPRNAARRRQESGKEEDAASFESETNAIRQNLVELATGINPTIEDCSTENSRVQSVDVDELEFEEESSWRARLAKNVILATLISAFLAVALLASGSPSLLPSFLTNNPVSTIWHESRYTQPAVAIMNHIEGLWKAEPVSDQYLPVDIRVLKLQVEALFQSAKNLSQQSSTDLANGIRRLYADIQKWWEILQELLLSDGDPELGQNLDQRGLFDVDWVHDWIEESNYEERLDDDKALLDYHYWELLPEYDIQAANEAVLGLMPESLRRDLLRNFSRLSDSLEVNALLDNLMSNLMKSKSGTTKQRVERLQHPEEFEELSTDVAGNRMDILDKEFVDGSFSSLPSEAKRPSNDYQDTEPSQDLETKTQMDAAKIEFPAEVYKDSQVINVESEGVLLFTSTDESNSEADLQDDNMLELEKVIPGESLSKGDSVAVIDALSHTNSLHAEKMTKGKFWDLGKIVFPVGITTLLLLVLGRYYMQFYDTSKLPASTVEFLKRSNPVQQENANDMLHQPMKTVAPMTMIEEMNGRLASMLQSPEFNANRWRSPSITAREDEELIRSPLVGSVESPYGSFTTLKMVSKKEGQGMEAKLTPVRRSNRLRNQINTSPNPAKRIAISPP